MTDIASNNADIDADEHEGLSGTFARERRTADRNRTTLGQILPFRQRDGWLLKYADERRLRSFLERRSEQELQRIERYISWKKSQ